MAISAPLLEDLKDPAQLGLPWTSYSNECPTVEELLEPAKAPTKAGLVVTMPYENSIMKHLDDLSELATIIGSCNNV
jgi:quinate dehydrogenase